MIYTAECKFCKKTKYIRLNKNNEYKAYQTKDPDDERLHYCKGFRDMTYKEMMEIIL